MSIGWGGLRRAAAVVTLPLLASACGTTAGSDGPDPGGRGREGDRGPLTIYSGRSEEFVAPLFEAFTRDTGIAVEVRYGDSAELAATIMEEGDNSPADVFFSQDAGSLGAVASAGLLTPLDREILQRVDPRFRSDNGSWVGTSGRGRVAVYNTELVDPAELPGSILGFADASWKGRVGLPPTNSSFQAHVAAMLITVGEDGTRRFLDGLMENGVRFYADNASTTRAVAAGEIEVGLVNHYYKYEVESEDGPLPIANHYFDAGDVGAFINAAGVGILATAPHVDEARRFVDYVTGEPGQRFVAEDTWEYPVSAGYEPSIDIPPLSELRGPDVDLSDLGARLPEALELLAEVGFV